MLALAPLSAFLAQTGKASWGGQEGSVIRNTEEVELRLAGVSLCIPQTVFLTIFCGSVNSRRYALVTNHLVRIIQYSSDRGEFAFD